jgi:hypothetical protein
MSTPKYSRANDLINSGKTDSLRPNLAHVVGTWFNTNLATGEIARLEISEQGSVLRLQIEGASPSGLIAWPPILANPFASSLDSDLVTGFEAHCDFGFMETHVAANIKHGVLVIQSYNRFQDKSGRGAYFTREFFHRRFPAEHTLAAPPDTPDQSHSDCTSADDLSSGNKHAETAGASELCGLWRNTSRETQVIQELKLKKSAQGYELNAFGSCPPYDWGTVPITVYYEGTGQRAPPAFFATYDTKEMHACVAANMNKGLLIIALYARFSRDQLGLKQFAREFFYRAGGPIT